MNNALDLQIQNRVGVVITTHGYNGVYIRQCIECYYNIFQNNITNAVPNNKGVLCFNGKVKMNHIDIDGGRGIVEKRYTNEGDKPCNFGGIGIGGLGEEIEVVKIDDMGLDNVGYIHCDAQGSENYLFSTHLVPCLN